MEHSLRDVLMTTTKNSSFDEPISYKKGSVLFTENEKPNFLYLIIKGEIRVVKEDKGRLIPLAILRDREILGELTVFTDENRSASAIVSSDAQLLIFKRSELKQVISKCPDWVGTIMNTISGRLINTVQALKEHRIIDNIFDAGNPLTSEEETSYKQAFDRHRSRKLL